MDPTLSLSFFPSLQRPHVAVKFLCGSVLPFTNRGKKMQIKLLLSIADQNYSVRIGTEHTPRQKHLKQLIFFSFSKSLLTLHNVDYCFTKLDTKSLPAPHSNWDMDGKRLLQIQSPSLPHWFRISSLSMIKWETFTPDLLIHQSAVLCNIKVEFITFCSVSCRFA